MEECSSPTIASSSLYRTPTAIISITSWWILGEYDWLEGGFEAGGQDIATSNRKGFYTRGLPIMGATVGTVFTMGAGSGLFCTGYFSTTTGKYLVSAGVNMGANYLGQLGAYDWQANRVDYISVGIAGVSAFVPGKYWIGTTITASGLDAAFDLDGNGNFSMVRYNKSEMRFRNDFFWGAAGGLASYRLGYHQPGDALLHGGNFGIGAASLYLNGKTDQKLLKKENEK